MTVGSARERSDGGSVGEPLLRSRIGTVADGTAVADAARALEREVFTASFATSAAEHEAEYGPYDDVSVFVAVTEAGQ